MLQGLWPFQPPSGSCLHLLDNGVVWSTWFICHICLPVVPKGSFWSIDHCIVCWVCWWARRWMLQDMDYMEASGVHYVEVGTLNQLQQCEICILTVTIFGIAMLTVLDYMTFSMCLRWDPGDAVRQTSADCLSIDEGAGYISKSRDFGSHSMRWLLVNKLKTSDQLDANRRTVGNLYKLQLYVVGFIFCWTCKLGVTHSIMTWS